MHNVCAFENKACFSEILGGTFPLWVIFCMISFVQEMYEKYSRDPCRGPIQWSDDVNAGFSTAQKTWLPVHKDYQTHNIEVMVDICLTVLMFSNIHCMPGISLYLKIF